MTRLIPNAGRVLAYSHSMHLTYWGLAALIVQVVVFLASGRQIFHPGGLMVLSVVLLALTVPGRVIDQSTAATEVRPSQLGWRLAKSFTLAALIYAAGAAMTRADVLHLAMGAPPPALTEPTGGLPSWTETSAFAVPLIQRWEGTGPVERCSASASGTCYRAYLDTIAEPDVPTVGHGQTRLFNADGSVQRAVRMGDLLTREEADRQFAVGLRVQYWQPYRACVTATRLAAETDAAFTSLTWNIGTGGVCRSTALARLNRGDVRGACEALTWWNRAGGAVVRGLVNRRSDEHAVCMRGA